MRHTVYAVHVLRWLISHRGTTGEARPQGEGRGSVPCGGPCRWHDHEPMSWRRSLGIVMIDICIQGMSDVGAYTCVTCRCSHSCSYSPGCSAGKRQTAWPVAVDVAGRGEVVLRATAHRVPVAHSAR